MTDLVWSVILVVGIVVAYGLGRLHGRDRARRGRVAPVVPLRKTIHNTTSRSVTHRNLATGATWHDGASQVRIVAAPRPQQFRLYDWQKRDGGVG